MYGVTEFFHFLTEGNIRKGERKEVKSNSDVLLQEKSSAFQ